MPDLKTTINRYNKFLRELPIIVSDVLIDFVLDNFDRQSFDGKPWPERADGDSSRALLVRSGRGRRSVRVTSRTAKRVTVGTDVDYMIAHNDGAEITKVITPRMRRFFWAMHYKFEVDQDGNPKVSPEDIKWKWLALKKGPITFRMPQRQFIGPSDELDRRLKEAIELELKLIFT